MNKNIIYIAAILLLSSIAFASIEINRIKVYVEDEIVEGIDEDGGDITVKRDDIIEFLIDMDNNRNNKTKVRLVGTLFEIDDGDDIEKDHDYYEIDANDDKTKRLTFVIPDDANIDNYDLELEIYFQAYNGSSWLTEKKLDTIEYIVEVEKDDDEPEEKSFSDTFSNMTRTCDSMIYRIDTCFGYINRSEEIRDDLSTCEEERGNYKHESTECGEDLKIKNDANNLLKNEKVDLQNKITLKEDTIRTMITNATCTAMMNQTAEEQKRKSNNNLAVFAALGVGGWWYWNNKKKKATVYDTTYNQREI